MSTPEGEKKIPQWSIFDRLDELEDITLELMTKTEATEPTLKETSALARDASIVARLGVAFGFISMLAMSRDPGMTTRVWTKMLDKTEDLSKEEASLIKSIMTDVLEFIEEQKKKPR